MAALRDRPNNRPPMIVAPEQDVPGSGAKAWAMPSFRSVEPGHVVHRGDANAVFPALRPQDDDAARDEGGGDGDGIEEVGLDGLAE